MLIIEIGEIETSLAGLPKARQQLQLALRVLELALELELAGGSDIQLHGSVYVACLGGVQHLEHMVMEEAGNMLIEVKPGL